MQASKTWAATSQVFRVALVDGSTYPPVDGLTGEAVVLDDTGRGESPIDKGWIIAVLVAAVAGLWGITRNDPIDRQNLKGVSA